MSRRKDRPKRPPEAFVWCGPEDCGFPRSDCRHGLCDGSCRERLHQHAHARRASFIPEAEED
jgi:hypothetical protein